jgi:hypothetical protein
MSDLFRHHTMELEGLDPARLVDNDALASTVIAAAGAIGLPTDGPPLVRAGSRGGAVGVLCRDGHIVLHTAPTQGVCLVSLAARPGVPVERGLEIIRRRLGA